MALSAFWKGVLAVGAALGTGALLTYIVGSRARTALPLAPTTLDPPIDDENCSRKFFPSPNSSGKRSKMPPTLIVLHDTEGGTAASNAAYFMNTVGRRVSAHITVDDSGACYRSVPDDDVAWAAGPVNPISLNIEMAAPSGAAMSRTEDEWLMHDTLLDVAAAHVALWCSGYGIPAKFIDAAGLKAGESGITTHAEVTRAFGGDHMDPGPGFPVDDFIERVRGRGGLFA
jgi:hypothetical protein